MDLSFKDFLKSVGVFFPLLVGITFVLTQVSLGFSESATVAVFATIISAKIYDPTEKNDDSQQE